jgi:hypothetical protein
MDRSRFKRIQHFSYGLLLLAVPAIFIVSMSSLPAWANVNSSANSSLNPSQAPASGLPIVGFQSVNTTVDEAVGTTTVNVVLDSAASPTATVEYLTLNGTAIGGTTSTDGDFIHKSGTLTFTGSDTTETFSIVINNDSIDEPLETFNLILRNPVNAELSSSNSTATISIQDNDPTPTNTPGSQNTPTPVYVDVYEPNNTLQNSYPIQADGGAYCNITRKSSVWPARSNAGCCSIPRFPS